MEALRGARCTQLRLPERNGRPKRGVTWFSFAKTFLRVAEGNMVPPEKAGFRQGGVLEQKTGEEEKGVAKGRGVQTSVSLHAESWVRTS